MSDLRDRILASACELYLAEGLDGFSMRKLARQVGVTAPALYRYHPSREHVLADLVRAAHREFSAELYRALEGGTPLERFARSGDGYLDFALRNARWYQLLFVAPEQMGLSRLPEDIEDMGRAIHQFWVDRVSECQAAGLLRPGDPAQISLAMWGLAHGLVSLYHHGHLRMDEATFRRHFGRTGAMMMVGLATVTLAAQLTEQYALDQGVGAHG